ncbi:MAG TPA: ankyrin repeat domain-containing protein [Acidobacteriota bacterium]|nr:ankyrin repeat domain-containing protein [Acidobacteriota bacterium]
MSANRRIAAACSVAAMLASDGVAANVQLQLAEAVQQEDAATVRALLQQGADVTSAQGDGATALHWAAYHDDLELVERLIAAGADVNASNDLSVTPLALACTNGSAPVVERLLDAGADPNVAGETGVTPLMQAVRIGSVGAVQALLEFEADVNARTDDRHQTALMWAAAQRHPEVVSVLLEYDADVHTRTRVRAEVVMLDLGRRRTARTAVEDATEIKRGGIAPLLFAALSGDVGSARLLLDAGSDVNDAGADGNSALVTAAFSGHGAVARMLLQAGADPDSAAGGYTALHAAVLRGDLNTVEALVAHGADTNAPLTKGSPIRRYTSHWALSSAWAGATPLMLAAHYLEGDIMRFLLRSGASRTALPNGTTPLLVAAGTYVERRINRPLDHSDTPTVLGDIFFARSAEASLEAVEILLDAGADANEASPAGDTPMHAAAANGFAAVIQLLADKGARLDAKNQDGQTPLAMTSGRGAPGSTAANREQAAELLRELGATE